MDGEYLTYIKLIINRLKYDEVAAVILGIPWFDKSYTGEAL